MAAEAWDELAATLAALSTAEAASPGRVGIDPRSRLRAALQAIIELCRGRPHLYRLMWVRAEPDASVVQAALRAQQAYLTVVAGAVGEEAAWQYGGVLLASVHGMNSLELGGHLMDGKWPRAEELVDLLVDRVAPTAEVT